MYRTGTAIKCMFFFIFLIFIIQSNKLEYIRLRYSHRQVVDLQPVRKVKSIDCLSLFNNEESAIAESRMQMLNNRVVVEKPRINITEPYSCKDLIDNNEYITHPLTKEEEEFPIAFSIMMHKDPEMFESLLRAIYRPQNFYCIHVDLKTFTPVYALVERISSCFPNVYMASQRINTVWGYTVLDSELVCMRDLLKFKWKYLINLTGQEYPLKTNWELVKILKIFDGANDIEGTIKRSNPKRWKHLAPPPHNLVPVKGATHIVVCRGYIEFALKDKRALDLLEWSRFTPHPEEVFFSTLNHNPSLGVPGSYLGEPETGPDKPFFARFKNWGEVKCYGKRVRSVCIIGVGDLKYLLKSPKLFVNKFNADFEPLARNCLEELIYNRTALASKSKLIFHTESWENLSFVKNRIR